MSNRINAKGLVAPFLIRYVLLPWLLVPMVLLAADKGTVVRIETSLGDIEVELFDTVAPLTVANFMNYVNDGDYTNSFIHRSIPGFVIQGGGFTFENGTVGSVPTDPPVMNEFNRSNIRGTIAMAKVSGDPDSATSQWFFNLADNSEDLDAQNGGFTVFGQVTGNGMDVVDAIAALPIWNAGSRFTNLPLINYSGTADILRGNLVMIDRIVTVSEPPYEFTIGGAVTALVGSGLVLHNNGGDDELIDGDGDFTFDTALTPGSTYNVTVKTQPSNPDQTCSVENGSGTVPNEDVTNIVVICSAQNALIVPNIIKPLLLGDEE